MAGKEPLSRERILAAALELVEKGNPDELTMRRLGRALGADPTALYRHFRDKDELMRVLGDRILIGVVAERRDGESWRDAVTGLCVRLRAVHLDRPQLAFFTRSAPSRQGNELHLTDVLLGYLAEAGFDPAAAAAAYHALIEYTIGSATIDVPLARLPEDEREGVYARWRREYAVLDPAEFPHSPAHAEYLYVGTATERFEDGLAALLDGLALRLQR